MRKRYRTLLCAAVTISLCILTLIAASKPAYANQYYYVHCSLDNGTISLHLSSSPDSPPSSNNGSFWEAEGNANGLNCLSLEGELNTVVYAIPVGFGAPNNNSAALYSFQGDPYAVEGLLNSLNIAHVVTQPDITYTLRCDRFTPAGGSVQIIRLTVIRTDNLQEVFRDESYAFGRGCDTLFAQLTHLGVVSYGPGISNPASLAYIPDVNYAARVAFENFAREVGDTVGGSPAPPEVPDMDDLIPPSAPAPTPQSDCEAGKMGWVLCPLIEGLDNALGGLYGWIEENFLQIDVEFYDTSSPTYESWQIFRNIANIVFVIFFLIVIFSQVTSIGVSNYGIKKMLPEIIMAAVLINLSYFICQAMVDLSNILGSQLRGLLNSISPNAGYASFNPDPATSGFFTTILIVAGVAVAGTIVATVLSGGIFALILGVLLALLVAAVAILMMFVILIVRQIGVIALIVLAPLAFAARILPNTQGLFKKWWSAFVALLVVYPVCSLVIGMGALAGAIIGGNANNADPGIAQGIWVIATVLAVTVPYFAVIKLSKGALGGLGKLGGMIAGRVQGVGAGINKTGARGLEAGKKKIDKMRGFDAKMNAKAQMAKDKAEQKASRKAAVGKGVYGKMQRSEFETAQYKDDATLASVGQYQGERETKEGRRLGKISDANAARLRINPDGTPMAGAPRFDPGSLEEHKQRQALTARQQQEAKMAKHFDEANAERDYTAVRNEVMDQNGNLTIDTRTAQGRIQTEQAVKKMMDDGEWNEAARLSDAYLRSGNVDRSAQRRLGSILTRAKDSKEKALPLHALGNQLQTNAGRNIAAPASLQDYFEAPALDANGGNITHDDGNGNIRNVSALEHSIANSDRYDNSIAGLHREAAGIIARYDSTGDIRHAIGSKTSGKVFAQMGDQAVQALGSDQIFDRARRDIQGMDGSTRASMGYSDYKQGVIGALPPPPPPPPPPPNP